LDTRIFNDAIHCRPLAKTVSTEQMENYRFTMRRMWKQNQTSKNMQSLQGEERLKVTVRIHKPTGLEFVTKKLNEDDTVTLRAPGKNRSGWRLHIKALEAKHTWFGRTTFYADTFFNAQDSWSYDYGLPEAQQPKYDKDTSKKYIAAKILEKAGEEPKDKSNSSTWILAILIVVGIVINVLVSTGRLRF
jgi:hypothetical protein